MLGLNDRASIREPVAEKKDEKKADKKDDKKDARAKPDAKPGSGADTAAKPDDKPVDSELSPDDAADAPQSAAPERTARSASGVYEFRDERWVELYSKKIEEMIGVLKSKGVPVLWVSLPAIRGQKGTADMLFLDALYGEASAKAGTTYVDASDGFVDEAGRFMQKGPDFEGQPGELRTDDGVFFTKAGARKLGRRRAGGDAALAARSGPIALPTTSTPDVDAVPGQPAPRPLAGPFLPSSPSSVGTDQCSAAPARGPPPSMRSPRALLVKGEPLAPPAGRADEFAWPRREIGREQARARRGRLHHAGWHRTRGRCRLGTPSLHRREGSSGRLSPRSRPRPRPRPIYVATGSLRFRRLTATAAADGTAATAAGTLQRRVRRPSRPIGEGPGFLRDRRSHSGDAPAPQPQFRPNNVA